MSSDYIPRSDAGKLAYGQNLSTLVTAGPVPLGVTPAIATQLAAKVAAYENAYSLAKDPGTRGGATVFSKDQTRDDMVAYIRQVVRQIDGTISVTDSQRYALGIPVRPTSSSPVPAPSSAPDVDVVKVVGRTVFAKSHDATSGRRRGRPAAVASASWYSYVGTTPPASLSGWHFEGNSAKVKTEIVFPATVPAGAQVWLAACWNNAKSQPGPMSAPITTNLPGGLSGAPESEAA